MKIKLFNIISLFLLLTMVCFSQINKAFRYIVYYNTQSSYNSNAQLYFNSLTTQLSDTIKQHLSNTCDCFDDSLNSGLRNKTLVQLGFDRLWLLANQTTEAALKDIVTLQIATAVSSPTFTQWQGYAGNGSSSYINSNFSPTDGVNYTQNSSTIFAYRRNKPAIAGTFEEMVGVEYGNPRTFDAFLIFISTTGFVYNINQVGDLVYTNASNDVAGMFWGNRSASNAVQLYRNGVSVHTGSTASVTLADIDFYILAENQFNGTTNVARRFTDMQLSIVGFGKSFTATEVRMITNCLEKKWMDKIGTGVIP